jgi:hypothetical protein
MGHFDSQELVLRSSSGQLSRMIDLDAADRGTWSEGDLPAMLRHQLSAPLKLDLGRVKVKGISEESRRGILADAEGLRIATLEDCFQHSSPPLALVTLIKDAFKAQAGPSGQRRPEQQVAYVIYLLAILVARVRLGAAITKLADAQLLRGIDWAATREWVDEGTKVLLARAREQLA